MAGLRAAAISGLEELFRSGTAAGLTDGQLLARFVARRGDAAAEMAFEAIVQRHGPMVLGVCRGLLGDPHEAEDAFQAVFLVLARRAPSLRRPDPLGPWLHGVARRTAQKARVRRARHERLVREAGDAKADPAEPIDRDAAERLHAEVGRLPERYRVPVVLCYFEGRTHEEAARLVGCPTSTLSVRLMRARERLRGRLERACALTCAPSASLIRQTACSAVPGAASPEIAALAAGVLTTMTLSKTMFMTVAVLAAGLLGAGSWTLAQPGVAASSQPVAVDEPKPASEVRLTVVEEQTDVIIDGETAFHIRVNDSGVKAATKLKLQAVLSGNLVPLDVSGTDQSPAYDIKTRTISFPVMNDLGFKKNADLRIHVKAIKPGQATCIATLTREGSSENLTASAGFKAASETTSLPLVNAGVEIPGKSDKAPEGWKRSAPIVGVTYAWDQTVGHKSRASLHISKTAQRYFPIAEWSQSVAHTGKAPRLRVSAFVKARKMTKAILDVQFLNVEGEWQHAWAAYIGQKDDNDPLADHDWKKYEGVVAIPEGTKTLVISGQVYGPGDVWFDDFHAEYTDDPAVDPVGEE